MNPSQKRIIDNLKDIAQFTLTSIGPYQGEKLCQAALKENLEAALNLRLKCETIVPHTLTNINGETYTVDGGLGGRTDIEIPSEKILLELKATTGPTKMEHLQQSKRYMDQKAEFTIGVVVNFISKDPESYVQIDTIVKTGEFKVINNIRFNTYTRLPTVNTEFIPSWEQFVTMEEAPTVVTITMKDNDAICNKIAKERATFRAKNDKNDFFAPGNKTKAPVFA